MSTDAGAQSDSHAEEEQPRWKTDIFPHWGRDETAMVAIIPVSAAVAVFLLHAAVSAHALPVINLVTVGLAIGVTVIIPAVLLGTLFNWKENQVRRKMSKIRSTWYPSDDILISTLADQAIENGASTHQENHPSLKTRTQFRKATANRDEKNRRRWLVVPGDEVWDRGDGAPRRARQAAVSVPPA